MKSYDPQPAPLWRHPAFLKLWAGQTISQIGSHIGGGALRYCAILLLGAAPLQLGILTAAQMLPILVLGLLVGVWVDRLRRRPLLIAADILRGTLLLAIPLAALLGALRVELLYLVALLAGALSVCFDVAYGAFLPAIVTREQLIEANSKLAISESLAEIAGPPLGGALVQLISAPLALLGDAISFWVSALSIWAIRADEPPPAPAPARSQLWHDLGLGLRIIGANPLLRPLLSVAITFNLFGVMIGTLYELYLIGELGLTPALVGITVGVGGISALLGAALAQPVIARYGLGATLIGTLVLRVCTMLLPLAGGPFALKLGILLVGQSTDFLFAIFMVAETSLRQSIIPSQLLGRVNASFQVLSTAAGLVGALLAGALGGILGVRLAIGIGALGVALSGLWVIGSPLARVRAASDLAPLHEQLNSTLPS